MNLNQNHRIPLIQVLFVLIDLKSSSAVLESLVFLMERIPLMALFVLIDLTSSAVLESLVFLIERIPLIQAHFVLIDLKSSVVLESLVFLMKIIQLKDHYRW